MSFFDAVAPHYDAVYGVPDADRPRRIAAMLEGVSMPLVPPRVVVLGVGTGSELATVREAIGGFTWIVAMDSSQAMVDAARTRAIGLGINVVRRDAFSTRGFLVAKAGLILASHGFLENATCGQQFARLARNVSRGLSASGVAVFEGPQQGYPHGAYVETEDIGLRSAGDGCIALVDKRTGCELLQRVWTDRQLADAFVKAGLDVTIANAGVTRIVRVRRRAV